MKEYGVATVPLEAQYLYRRGREMMDQQKEDIALAYLKQAVFIAPGFSKAYRELGNCLVRLGRPEEASGYYQRASRRGPVSDGSVTEGISVKGEGKNRPVAGSCLTFLVW